MVDWYIIHEIFINNNKKTSESTTWTRKPTKPV